MQPHSLAQAVSFARLHEEKLLDGRQPSVRPPPTTTTTSLPSQPSPPPATNSPESPLLPSVTKPHSSTIPFKRLSPTELARRWEKGLFFNCEEKYSRGHKCSSSCFLFVTEDDECLQEIDPGPLSPTSLATSQDKLPAQIILHALSGHGAPETLRVTGLIANHQVQILIDGRSTHNFQQQELVSSLNLCPHNTSTLRVMVGNGEELHCHQVFPGVLVHIQKHDLKVDFHVLPIRGAGVVLGMQWLK